MNTALTCVLLVISVAADADPPKRPHILLLLADDFGWANLGVHRRGHTTDPQALAEAVTTPTLDQLADDGILLTHHYAFKICAPSRSSLHSGRLAVHVNSINTAPSAWNPNDPVSGYAGIPRNMTTLASKLRGGGYKTAFYGKWDIGMATHEHTPVGRGYEDAFFFYHHANNYYDCGVELEATGEVNVCLNAFTDLSEANLTHPGRGYTELRELQARARATGDDELAYVETLFKDRALRTISEHDPTSQPLFLFYSFHLLHTPMQVPFRYLQEVDARVAAAGGAPYDSQNRRLYGAMTLFLDNVVKGLVEGVKTNPAGDMWENTVLLFLADNGGPVYYPGAASNFPLRGGKYNDWEGGVRTAAFLSGGAVPAAKRGTSYAGVISIADWYGTFCELAGVDSHDVDAEDANEWLQQQQLPVLPPVESIPMWSSIMSNQSAREEVHLSENALLRWPYKLVTGVQPYSVWTGQVYPNCSTHEQLLNGEGPMFLDMRVFGEPVWIGSNASEQHRLTWAHDCGAEGCLVNLALDPTEHVDLADHASTDPAIAELLQQLGADLAKLNEGVFRPDRGEDSVAVCNVAMQNGGFYGPFVRNGEEQSPQQQSLQRLGLFGFAYMELVQRLAASKQRVVATFRAVIPNIGAIVVKKFEVCNPDPSTTGIRAGGFKLDKVIIPVFILLTFWKEVALVFALILIARRYQRQAVK